ncbi:MAG: hypothetical protein HYY08_00845 [Firmicutes bacterium]|nr:hypothetical protein [Bacillota bacterium]
MGSCLVRRARAVATRGVLAAALVIAGIFGVVPWSRSTGVLGQALGGGPSSVASESRFLGAGLEAGVGMVAGEDGAEGGREARLGLSAGWSHEIRRAGVSLELKLIATLEGATLTGESITWHTSLAGGLVLKWIELFPPIGHLSLNAELWGVGSLEGAGGSTGQWEGQTSSGGDSPLLAGQLTASAAVGPYAVSAKAYRLPDGFPVARTLAMGGTLGDPFVLYTVGNAASERGGEGLEVSGRRRVSKDLTYLYRGAWVRGEPGGFAGDPPASEASLSVGFERGRVGQDRLRMQLGLVDVSAGEGRSRGAVVRLGAVRPGPGGTIYELGWEKKFFSVGGQGAEGGAYPGGAPGPVTGEAEGPIPDLRLSARALWPQEERTLELLVLSDWSGGQALASEVGLRVSRSAGEVPGGRGAPVVYLGWEPDRGLVKLSLGWSN